MQECEAGLVKIRRTDADLAFAAPPLVRSGPVEPAVLDQAIASLGIDAAQVLGSNWVDNGPGWMGSGWNQRSRCWSCSPTSP